MLSQSSDTYVDKLPDLSSYVYFTVKVNVKKKQMLMLKIIGKHY